MKLIPTLLVSLTLAWTGSAAMAQGSFPEGRPITMVVPFAAGSGTDAVARVVGAGLAKELGQTVVVDNRPGANAQIAAQAVARAKPDGHTLFMTTNTSHSANPWLVKNLRYDAIKDFTPIARVGELPFALAVNPSLPVKNLKELIAYVKANPGKVSYATPNSTSLVASETLRFMTGADILNVPYAASPQALTDLISGQIDMYIVDLGSGLTQLRTDRLRTLAVTTGKPSALLPGVPSMRDDLPGFDITSWNGIFAPAGTPDAVVQKINTALQAVLADPKVKEQLAQIGFEIWPTKTPAEFATYVQEQLDHWGKLVKQAGIEPQ